MADVFKALADPTRRLILDELADRDGQTLFEICAVLISGHGIDSSRQAISQHLAVLEEAGLLTVEWRGRSKMHHLDRGPLVGLTKRWLEPGCEPPGRTRSHDPRPHGTDDPCGST